jgi:galactose mutarotase-like enzyme
MAVLSLESNDETRTQFPWDFAFDMTFTLRGNTLRLEQRIVNRSTTPMPFGVGFHPYFYVPDAEKAKARITTGHVARSITSQANHRPSDRPDAAGGRIHRAQSRLGGERAAVVGRHRS